MVMLSRWPPFFFFNDTATTEIYTLSLHDALPISAPLVIEPSVTVIGLAPALTRVIAPFLPEETVAMPSLKERSEEHTSELQSLRHLVCRLLLEKKMATSWADSGLGLSGEVWEMFA